MEKKSHAQGENVLKASFWGTVYYSLDKIFKEYTLNFKRMC